MDKLTNANKRFIDAERDSMAAVALVRQVLTQSQEAYNTYNLTFTTLSLAKTINE